MATIKYDRKVASQLGALLGMNLIMVKRKNVDAGYSEKEREGKQRLANEVYLYGLERIRIKKAELVDLGEGKQLVQFNDNSKLQLELAEAKDMADIIKKPTTQEIIDAISSSAVGIPKFFVDDASVTELVCAFNQLSRREISSMMETLSRQASALDDANRIMQDACKAEMANIGIAVDFKPINIGD